MVKLGTFLTRHLSPESLIKEESTGHGDGLPSTEGLHCRPQPTVDDERVQFRKQDPKVCLLDLQVCVGGISRI